MRQAHATEHLWIEKSWQNVKSLLSLNRWRCMMIGGNPPLEKQIGAFLTKYGKTISVAESCTGGLISHRITNVPGSSNYFDRGVIAYSNQSKTAILRVSPETLKKFGAVSRQTAIEMAQGIKQISGSDLGLAVTGIAGPGGGTPEKPVGLVYICLTSDESVVCEDFRFKGKREEIKHQTSEAALELIKKHFKL